MVRVWIGLAALAASYAFAQEPEFPTEKEQAATMRVFGALEKRLARIKTLSMRVVHGNFSDWNAGPRTIRFPPPRKPKEDDPKTVEDCFNLFPRSWHRLSHTKFHGKKVIMLEHIARDGADGYGIIYISERTGWPVATGYAPDRSTPRMTEFTHLHVRLKREVSPDVYRVKGMSRT